MDILIETERLRLRPLREEDALPLYEAHREQAVRQWFPNESYADPEEALEAIRFFAHRVGRGMLPYVLAVERKDTGEWIGDTGVSAVDGHPDEGEIGCVIRGSQRGKGYAAEAVGAMGRLAASTFGLRVLHGRVLHGNTASARMLEKSGYRFVGEEFGAEDDPYGRGMLIYRTDNPFSADP